MQRQVHRSEVEPERLRSQAAALFALGADRRLGAQVFNPENGGAILWQHLFWFFGHPEVYVIALPFFGIVSEIFPVFSRKPIFGYKGLIYATISIAALSVTVWAHHMYVTGAVLLPFSPSTCCTRKVVWNPMNRSQKWTLPKRSLSIRPVRSERPAYDLHHPEVAALDNYAHTVGAGANK